MKNAEKEMLLRGTTAELKNKLVVPVVFELDFPLAVALVGQLQLAFRHPQNVGPTRKMFERFARDLIERLDPAHGDIHRVLLMGFDKANDV